MSSLTLGRTPHSSALHAARRTADLLALGDGPDIDVLVVGGGITGAGLALDAASRGLRTVLVERHDLAFGTSRWSSKLVHGGLRYLASGQIGIAHESAAERHLLMTRIAPHLTRPLAQVVPLHGSIAAGAYVGLGYGLGDGLRRAARTPRRLLPPPRFIDRAATVRAVPAVRSAGLRGAVLGWDGQLIDDARLVIAVARTAAGYGASILTRVEATQVTGDGATLRDALTGETLRIRSRAILIAAGVWTGSLDPQVRLRPSRGTHLVVPTARLGGADASLTVPVPGSRSRFVFAVPGVHGRSYIGLTDVPVDGPPEDAPRASESEIDELLATINSTLADPLTRGDVLATYSGLRPLLVAGADDAEGRASAASSDLSRRHAVRESEDGALSVVGGKLTTYRRMAQDGVDEAIRRRAFPTARPSRTAAIPLVGAWPRERSGEITAAPRFVRRYGAEAPYVAALGTRGGGAHDATAACGVTAQELEWGVRLEGALSLDDLLARRTRLALVPHDAEASRSAAAAAFDRAGVRPVPD